MELKDFYFFDALTMDEIEELKSISLKKHFYKGNVLFYKGAVATHLYLLLNGIAKVYKHDEKGNEIVIHSITAPSFIAEIANFNRMPYPANCVFEIDSDVLVINYAQFEEKFLNKPKIALQFIQSLSKKIKVLEAFISNNINKNSTAKIAKFLYENEEQLAKLKNIQIASILNITPETLSRKITLLKKEGIIVKDGGGIRIVDRDRLLLKVDK
jgi:CRP/FNR family transcriptional regulator